MIAKIKSYLPTVFVPVFLIAVLFSISFSLAHSAPVEKSECSDKGLRSGDCASHNTCRDDENCMNCPPGQTGCAAKEWCHQCKKCKEGWLKGGHCTKNTCKEDEVCLGDWENDCHKCEPKPKKEECPDGFLPGTCSPNPCSESEQCGQRGSNLLCYQCTKLKEEETPPKTACSTTPFKPVQIGPKSKYGSGFSKVVQDSAKKVIGGLFGSLMKGPVSQGTPESPPLTLNPFKKMVSFTDPETGTVIKVAGKQTDKGILIGSRIEKGDGKPTFHSITLHRDEDCAIMLPTQYFLYELWLKWELTVSWTKTTYVNNQVVKQEHGGWSKKGSELLDRGIFAGNQGGKDSIWQHFGFDRATEGPQAVGVAFDTGSPGNLAKDVKAANKVVIHVTRPNQDPVVTVPFTFAISPMADGTLGFEQIDNLK